MPKRDREDEPKPPPSRELHPKLQHILETGGARDYAKNTARLFSSRGELGRKGRRRFADGL